MLGRRWYAPLDPQCPGAQAEVYGPAQRMAQDPLTIHYGVDVSEFSNGWEQKHRSKCKRCQEYGAAHIDIV